jgi:hypothetical protein
MHTDLKYRGGIPNAGSPDQGDLYQRGYTGKASPVRFLMVIDKLASAILTRVILGAVAFFPFRTITVP